MVVVVRMVLGGGSALTGRVGRPSTPGLAVVAAASLAVAQLDEGVGRSHPQLGSEGGVVGSPVGNEGPWAWSRPRFLARLCHNPDLTANAVVAPVSPPWLAGPACRRGDAWLGGTMTGMRLADKVLVHQVHPVKIGADITASTVSNVLLWRGQPKAAVAVRILLSVAGSAAVISMADLGALAKTRRGQYVLEHIWCYPTTVRRTSPIQVRASGGPWRCC
jgi:hypothetical protein